MSDGPPRAADPAAPSDPPAPLLPPPPLPPTAVLAHPPPPQPGRSGSPGPNEGPDAAADPELVEKIVGELKNRGIFDQVRKECLAEVDTKPAFQNLRQRVESSLNRFLSKENQRWTPNMNKNQLRNQLRKYIQEANYMDAGVERIVDQVVNPKIYSSIEPEVEGVIYDYLGVEKPSEKDLENGNGSAEKKDQEKLSNISSEDIEMRSVGEAAKGAVESPKPQGGDISPLTPDRKKLTESPVAQRGDISPLTPPAPPPPPISDAQRPPSPRTPPLPPLPISTTGSGAGEVILQQGEEVAVQEEVVAGGASPVSDTELGDVSPPTESPKTPSDSGLPSPPLPPLPPQPPPPAEAPDASIEMPPLPPPPEQEAPAPLPPRPPSPLTSPIGSSPDEMEVDQASERKSATSKSASGPSDISDTDLPASQSEGEDQAGSSKDLDALEKKRAAITKQLEKTKIEGDESEGEIRSDDDDDDDTAQDYMKKFEAIIAGGGKTQPEASASQEKQGEESTSPVSSSISPLAVSKNSASEEDEGEERKKKRGDGNEGGCKQPESKGKRDDDSDDSKGGDGQGGSSKGQPKRTPEQGEPRGGSGSNSPKDSSDKKEGSSSSKSRDSSSKHRSSHHHHRHHKDERRSSSKRDHHGHHRRSSTSSRRESESSSSKHRRDSTGEGRSDKKDKSSRRPEVERKDEKLKESKKEDSTDKKDVKDKKRKLEKERSKIENLDKKIRENATMKSTSGAFKEVDMFAPKPPKPKVVPPGSRTPSTASPSGATSPFAFGSKSPPVFAVKTPPPAFPHKTQQVTATKSAPPGSSEKSSSKKDLSRRQSQEDKNGSDGDLTKKIKTNQSFIVPDRAPERKVFPEVPVPSTEGDKLKQHENDIEMAKRRLQEMRNRKMEEVRRKEREKKELKRQSSHEMTSNAQHKKVKEVSTASKVVARKSAPPPQREEARKSLDKPIKKKLTLEDLSDSESDWSGDESSKIKKRIKKRASQSDGSNDNSGSSTPTLKTRKAALQTQSDLILKSDAETRELLGFSDDDCIAASRNKAKLLPFFDDEDSLSVSSFDSDKMEEEQGKIYLDGLESPAETAQLLGKFGGHPRVVPPMPDWLQAKLQGWMLRRDEVNVFFRDAKPKRCVMERTFSERMRKRHGLDSLPHQAKKRKVEPAALPENKDATAIVAAAPETDELEELKKEMEQMSGVSATVKVEANRENQANADDLDDDSNLPVDSVGKDDKNEVKAETKIASLETKDKHDLKGNDLPLADQLLNSAESEHGENETYKQQEVVEGSIDVVTGKDGEEMTPGKVEEEAEGAGEKKPTDEDEKEFRGFSVDECNKPSEARLYALADMLAKCREGCADGGFRFGDLLEHLEAEALGAAVEVGDTTSTAIRERFAMTVTLPGDFAEDSSKLKDGHSLNGERTAPSQLPLSPPDSEGSMSPSINTKLKKQKRSSVSSTQSLSQDNSRATRRSRRSVAKVV